MPLGEKALIRRVRGMAKPGRGVVAGIGDDAAILCIPPGHEALVTTDFTLEGVHFRREWHPPEVVGRRCLTRGLSDIAAMGGVPISAFLSLALPPNTRQAWVDKFLKGLLALADEFQITLGGGDTAESPAGILADIVVVGSVPKGRALLRSTARVGDEVYVTGELGGSTAALELLFRGAKLAAKDFPRHFRPTPRVEVGERLREHSWASAMIDTSDGLSTDLAHICEESSVGAELFSEDIPRAKVGRPPRPVELRLALDGGEDYELLFTASVRKPVPSRIAGVPITKIGRIIRGSRMFLVDEKGRRRELKPGGWQHFSR
jgi:thiamine-monophosphate kinase